MSATDRDESTRGPLQFKLEATSGRARAGTTRAAQWAGGGVVFGPVPRKYEHELTKKMRRSALLSALSNHCTEGLITVIDSFGIDEYKTSRMVGILDALGLSGQTVLIAIDQSDPYVEGSARNIPGVTVIRTEGLNVYDLLRHSRLLLTQAALEGIERRFAAPSKEEASP